MERRFAGFGLLLTMMLVLQATAEATPIRFDYTGVPLTHVQGPLYSNVTAITGYIVLDSADIVEGVEQTYAPLSYSFTDGRTTLTQANSGWTGGLVVTITGGTLIPGLLGTDLFHPLDPDPDAYPQIEAFEMFSFQERSLYCVTPVCQGGSTVSVYLNSGGGTWSSGEVIPEPTTGFLLGTGVLGIAAVRRRRDAKFRSVAARDVIPRPTPMRPLPVKWANKSR